MTRSITDVVANLILPPAGPLLIAIAGLILARRHRRLGIAVGAFGIVLLWIPSLPVVGALLLRPLEPPPSAPLLVLIGALDDWTRPRRASSRESTTRGVTVGANPRAREEAYAAVFELLERELR